MFTAETARSAWEAVGVLNRPASIFHGDSLQLVHELPNDSLQLTVTSPPYCMGKEYESKTEIESFVRAHEQLLPEIIRATAPGGHICWQIGNYVRKGEVVPLDFLVYDIMRNFPEISLRNRIIWTFGHGLHCQNRFSGRYETVLWFSKGSDYYFDLDSVRVPQKYPGKRAAKGPRKGSFSGNPLGKNPGDVWDIPNVKANHIEKTIHPCQFPVALVQRLVKALSPKDGVVFDPYSGVGSTGVAAVLEGRRFIGGELNKKYVDVAIQRISETLEGKAKIRPLDLPVYEPGPNESVARRPEHFWPPEQMSAQSKI